MTRRTLWIVVALGLAGLAAFVYSMVHIYLERAATEERLAADPAGTPRIGGPFALVDHTGKAVTDEDYRGKWLLVFFGYTSCPDVCPTALNEVAEVMDGLGRDAARVRPLFITVDPERDTPEVMAEYVAAFDPRIVGLTGTVEQVGAAAASYRVYYAKAPDEGAPGGYYMTHSAFLYLVDPEGRFRTMFGYEDDPAKILSGIRKYL